MDKDVIVSVSGLQFENGDNQPVEIISFGECYIKNGKRYILYDEVVQENGLHFISKNTIKIRDKEVEILKRGNNNIHMVFQEGKKNMTYYNTPFGNFLLGVYTTKIKFMEEMDRIRITIEYNLEMNYTHISDYAVDIIITSRK